MYLLKFRILIAGILLFIFQVMPAAAVTLTVGSDSGGIGETLTIPITVNNPEGVSGAAFTIVYPSALTVTVSSEFFDTFYSQFDSLATTGDPNPDSGEYGTSVFPLLDGGVPTGEVINIPAVVDSVDYYQPLITNSIAAGLMISAARCVPGPAGGPAVLFSLEVQLKGGESAGTYPIQIIPTELNNTNAGYDAEGETIDLVIGSDPAQPLESAFTVLLDDVGYETNVTSGQAEFVPLDSDEDGLFDTLEDAGCTGADDADTDNDGIADGAEDANKNGIVDAGETNPCNIDTDGDGIQDGTEMGLTTTGIGPGTDTTVFQPDLDNATKTDPLDADSDDDGVNDGQEDLNKNGRLDAGETDPNVKNVLPKKAMPWIPLLLLGD
jgi:hypothetical protein